MGPELALGGLFVLLIVLVRMHQLIVVLCEEVDPVLACLRLLDVGELCLRDELPLRIVGALTSEIILAVDSTGV